MSKKPCYKEDSLNDFAVWAKECGHYCVAPLINNYREFLSNATEEKPDRDENPE